MTNRLINENSPYLLQHAENPVDWHPWGEEALELAKQLDKPIFLSIGYAACHWCHVMAHESFEDPATATVMNDNFICVKVDREERPDLDAIYMSAVVAMTGSGGWPMSVFLTPALEPFFGGTYFPSTRRYNLPGFREILISVARLWRENREKLLSSADEITEHIARLQEPEPESGQDLKPEMPERALLRLAQSYDWNHGGWGAAPKFPQPMAIEFLLRRAARGDGLALDIARHALHAMSAGGMFDVLGGGFARYSTDAIWLIPHFEKMLYDNALLARVYLYAFLITRDEHLLDVCRKTLDFLIREMMSEEGGFYSSLDADSEGFEGKYYIWDYDEIEDAIRAKCGNRNGAEIWIELFATAYGLSRAGNFEGKNVLQKVTSNEELSARFNLHPDAIKNILQEIRQSLFIKRMVRLRPDTDDKSLLAWNALALRAFAEAGRYLHNQQYLQIAQCNAEFLCSKMMVKGKLFRSYRNGQVKQPAFLEDYAAFVLGLLSLYQSDRQLKWHQTAVCLVETMMLEFEDPRGGFFDTGKSQSDLLVRPKDLQDNAAPSGNSLAAMAIIEAAAFNGKGEWLDKGHKCLQTVIPAAAQYPTAYGNHLCAIDLLLSDVEQLAILCADDETGGLEAFERVIWERFRPNLILAAGKYPPSPGSPELLLARPLSNGQTTAYLCRDFNCKLPVTTPQALSEQLNQPFDRF